MVFGFLRRKKKEEPLPEVELPPEVEKPKVSAETTTAENVKAKMDLILTQMDSLRTQYENLNERIIAIERMIKEMYDMAKSG